MKKSRLHPCGRATSLHECLILTGLQEEPVDGDRFNGLATEGEWEVLALRPEGEQVGVMRATGLTRLTRYGCCHAPIPIRDVKDVAIAGASGDRKSVV